MLRRTTHVSGWLSGGAGAGQQLVKTPPAQAAQIITAATRGLNVSIAEGLAIEREQFARMAAPQDTREALDAWLAARASR